MNPLKYKNIKWWIGAMSCTLLFSIIGVFAFMKMEFLWKGVQISAEINKENISSLSSLTNIKGEAKNANLLSLNGREIFINKEGKFSEMIALMPGLSVITLSAKDKFGNLAEKKFEVIYKESAGVVAYNVK